MKSLLLALIVSSQLFAQSVDLRSEMTPVQFQGDRNTCSAFASTALMEFLIKHETGEELNLSENNAYWSGRKFALDNLPWGDRHLKDAYHQIDGLAGYLAVEGYRYQSALEEEWPYENRNLYQQQDPRCDRSNPTNICFVGERPANVELLPYRIDPIFVDRDKMGDYILKNRKPLVYNIKWYPGAVNSRTGAIRMPTQADLNATSYGHVILLVGYNKETKTFIYRNSWGPSWGDAGYGTVPEEFLINYCEMCSRPQGTNKNLSSYKAYQGVSGNLIIANE